MIFMTPPKASAPYKVDDAPLTTSMRSIALVGIAPIPLLPFRFIGIPFTRTSAPRSRPRIFVRLSIPPKSAPDALKELIVTPGTLDTASKAVLAPLFCISSWVITEVDTGVSKSKRAVRLAVTLMVTSSSLLFGVTSAAYPLLDIAVNAMSTATYTCLFIRFIIHASFYQLFHMIYNVQSSIR